MSNTKMNPDIKKERDGASFDPDQLTEVLYGGKEIVRRRRYLQNLALQDKYIQSFTKWWNRGREEEYDACVKKSVYLHKLMQDLNITNPLERFFLREAAACQETNVLGLHEGMFMPTIEKQATEAQKKKYLEPAKNLEIIGTYAQTELGHGTFIRGLETTATYDPKTEEFVIHSPTLTSMKFWPGALGKTSNHVVLMAQLYTQGKCYGIHAFVVQIRSRDDHKPMPGVTVGDIGNKLGYSGMDNGFLMFNKYRVPRDAMLMRYSKVEKDGTYLTTAKREIAYGTMVYIRATLVEGTGRALTQAVTIATRYSAVRRQTEIRPGGPEPQVIDYQTQQQKLFPLLASSYALMFCGQTMLMTYMNVTAEIEKGNMAEMQMLHALAAGLKALSADITSDGIDKLRMSCGGHGYTHASGIPKIWANITPATTYEGENTVMYLQCARYLVKCYGLAVTGSKLPEFMKYLGRAGNEKSKLTATCDLPTLIQAYEHTAARLIRVAALKIQSLTKSGVSVEEARNKTAVQLVQAAKSGLNEFKIQSLTKSGVSVEEARNKTSVQLVQAAKAHSRTYVVKVFTEYVQRPDLSADVSRVLGTLCQLYAVCGINNNLGEFIQDGFLSGKQAEMLMDKMLSLFAAVRPDAVALVDAFDYPDHVLQSCLGRYDGNVYEALYEYAKGSPLNKQDVMDSYHTTLRPLMKGELKSGAPSARL